MVDENKFDVRVIEARLRRGAVTADEYRQFLESLPDDADKAEPCRAQFSSVFGDKGGR